MRRTRLTLALLLALPLGGLLWGTAAREAAVETGRSPRHPDLLPRRYPLVPAVAEEAARAAAGSLRGWKGVEPAGGGILRFSVDSFLGGLSSVEVRIVPDGGRSMIFVASRSPGWRPDFGGNARNVRAFLDAFHREAIRRAGPPPAPPTGAGGAP